MSDVQKSGQCSRRPLERLWIVIWFVQVNRIIQLTNYYNKLGFLCSLETVCTVVKIIWFSASCTREQRQQAALITSWQQSAVIMALRTDSHHSTVLSTTWRSFLLVTVMTAPLQWRALSLAHICGTLILMNPPLFLRSRQIWCGETLCVCVKPPSSSTDVCSFPLLAGLEDSIAEIKRDCFVPMMWWPTKPLDETGCPSASPQSH